jgi:hypothetical protein
MLFASSCTHAVAACRHRRSFNDQEVFMQFAKPVVLGFSLLALAAASAYANDSSKQKQGSSQQPSMSQSNTSPSSDRSAAAGGSSSSSKSSSGASGDQFNKLDKNGDGNLSREEWQAGQRSGASGSSTPSSTGSSSGSSSSAPAPKSKTDTSKPMGGTSK